MNVKNASLIKSGIILLFFAGLVFWLYSATLESPFVFDDVKRIEKNAHIRVTHFSLREFVSAGLKSSTSRFLAYISFALNYYFHQYDPVGYHLVNIGIHIINGFLLYLFLNGTLKIYAPPSRFDHPDMIAFLAALIWLVHPVQTQSVIYIVQRMNSMAVMFFMISFWCYLKARITDKGRIKWLWFSGAVFAWLLSLGCKQITVTLPIFVFIYEWFFFQDLDKKWFKRSLPFLLAIVILLSLAALVYTDFHPLKKLSQFHDFNENQFTVAQRVLTQPRVVMHYISLLIFPHPSRLNLDYDFPLSYSLINPMTTMLFLIAILGFIILGVYLARKQRLISFCILWFFGNLVIESSVIPLALIFEHRLYLPSMLLFLIPVTLGYRHIRWLWLRTGLLCFAVVVLSVWTYQRNQVWGNEFALWTDVVKKSPSKARPRVNLGLALASQDRLEEAIRHYTKSIQIDPDFAEAYNNLGVALKAQGKVNEAIRNYRKAVQINPAYAEALNNLAAVYVTQGRTDDAIDYYRRSLRIEPDSFKVHSNLGHVFAEQGKFNKAIEHYRKALQLSPNNAETLFNWGATLAKQGKTDQAISYFHKALEIDPNDARAHNNLGGELLKLGKTDEALDHFSAALELDPNLAQAHSNMGVLLIQKGKTEAAISHFQEALRINPGLSSAAANLKMVLAIQKQMEAQTTRINQALKVNPDDQVLHFEMGNIYLGKHEYGKAIAEFEKALSIQPDFAEAQYNLALACAADKQYDKALGAFKKMVALQPDNPNTYYNIAALYALLNDIDGSLEWLERAIEKGYQNWELIESDEDLNNIRNSAGYKELIKAR